MKAGFTTPGPWTVSPFRAEVIEGRFGRDGNFLPVARMLWPTDERSEAETYANARQMAAAPDLFEAVRLFVEEYDGGSDDGVDMMLAYERALTAGKAALAKARGDA